MVAGLLGNESFDSNRFTLVTPKSENDVRLQATLGNQNPTGLPVGVVSIERYLSKKAYHQIGDTLFTLQYRIVHYRQVMSFLFHYLYEFLYLDYVIFHYIIHYLNLIEELMFQADLLYKYMSYLHYGS